MAKSPNQKYFIRREEIASGELGAARFLRRRRTLSEPIDPHLRFTSHGTRGEGNVNDSNDHFRHLVTVIMYPQ
jgi:hypothetical protein